MALLGVCAGLALFVSLAMPSAALAQGQTVDLHLRLVPGQVHSYQMTVNTSTSGSGFGAMAAGGLGADVTIPFDVLTLVGNPDGSGTIVITFGDATASTAGGRQQALPSLSGTRIEETLDASGNVVSVHATPELDTLGGDMSPLNLSSELFSGGVPRSLRVGETVDVTRDVGLPQSLGDLNAQAQVTLVGVPTVDGMPAAQLDTTITIPGASLDFGGIAIKVEGSANGTSLIDIASGWARSAQIAEDLSLAVVPDPDAPAIDLAVHVDINLQLVGVSQMQGK